MNFDDYEQLPTTSVATNMTAGALAGIMEHCVMYPMDSVKTRMQSLSHMRAHDTIYSTLRQMVREEGILRPFRGVAAVVAGAGKSNLSILKEKHIFIALCCRPCTRSVFRIVRIQ